MRMDGISICTSATRQKNLTYPSRHDGWHKLPHISHNAEATGRQMTT